MKQSTREGGDPELMFGRWNRLRVGLANEVTLTPGHWLSLRRPKQVTDAPQIKWKIGGNKKMTNQLADGRRFVPMAYIATHEGGRQI